MTVADRTRVAAPTGPFAAWRTWDILLAAIIGVAFGLFFFVWNGLYAGLEFIQPPVLKDVVYGGWLIPAVLAPALIRKPGAAVFAEMVAAGVSVLFGTPWGPDVLLSGFVQGAAAELVFAMTGYRTWSLPVLAAAAVGSAIGAWLHDWAIYYAETAIDIQLIRLALMAVSAVVLAGFGALAIERSLRKAGVLEGRAG
ncbi:MAG TPA: ECF transporter S component [Candidatus Binatia bacterium]|nr:ECF transporter S component [Candidatus Binatia bacterium]